MHNQFNERREIDNQILPEPVGLVQYERFEWSEGGIEDDEPGLLRLKL